MRRQYAPYCEEHGNLDRLQFAFHQRVRLLPIELKRSDYDDPKVKVTYTLPLLRKPPCRSEVLSFVKKSGEHGTDIILLS